MLSNDHHPPDGVCNLQVLSDHVMDELGQLSLVVGVRVLLRGLWAVPFLLLNLQSLAHPGVIVVVHILLRESHYFSLIWKWCYNERRHVYINSTVLFNKSLCLNERVPIKERLFFVTRLFNHVKYNSPLNMCYLLGWGKEKRTDDKSEK